IQSAITLISAPDILASINRCLFIIEIYWKAIVDTGNCMDGLPSEVKPDNGHRRHAPMPGHRSSYKSDSPIGAN
ncbi:MAG: hypothetical protein P8178_06925, partial [Candidatus Thiodiazotropha sp.]